MKTLTNICNYVNSIITNKTCKFIIQEMVKNRFNNITKSFNTNIGYTIPIITLDDKQIFGCTFNRFGKIKDILYIDNPLPKYIKSIKYSF